MRSKKWRIKAVVFLLLGCCIFLFVQKILTPKWIYGASGEGETNKFQTFYELEENSLDYLIIGDSKSFYSVNPMLIYEETGLKGYALGSTGAGTGLEYYWLEEALKYQSPTYVFMDVGSLLSESAICATGLKYEAATAAKALTYMRFGETKIRACLDNQTEERDWLQLLFPLLFFHTRWDDLGERDFFYDNGDYALMGSFITFHQRNDTHILEKTASKDYLSVDLLGRETRPYSWEVNDENRAYFEKILQLCHMHSIRLIPFTGPTTYSVDEKDDASGEFLKEYDLELLTFTNQELGIDWDQDTPDDGIHINYWGNCKYSAALGRWLQGQGSVDAASDAETSEYWDSKLDQYQKFEAKRLINNREQVFSYFRALEASLDKCMVLISVKDEACEAVDQCLAEYMERLGLHGFEGEHLQNSYIAVISGGDAQVERWAAAPLRLEDELVCGDGTRLGIQMKSGGFAYGNMVELQIDDTDYAAGVRGINVVVLDQESGRVISSVGIDTHSSKWTLTQRELDEDAAEIWDSYTEASQMLPDGVYTIHPFGNPEYALDISGDSREDNANLQLWNSTGEGPQQFRLQYQGDGLYTIRAVNSGKYLTAYEYGNTNGTNVVQDAYTGGANQKWYLYRDGNGGYRIMSHYNKLVMDVEGTQSGAGINIFLYEPVDGDWQTFEFQPWGN